MPTMTPTEDSKFQQTSVSPAGAPDIVFDFDGATVRAELAGAKLYAEMGRESRIDLRLTDATGFVLADIALNPRPERNDTENIMDIGAALLWSHWRFLQVQQRGDEQAVADGAQ